jgi:hypothetical protein
MRSADLLLGTVSEFGAICGCETHHPAELSPRRGREWVTQAPFVLKKVRLVNGKQDDPLQACSAGLVS